MKDILSPKERFHLSVTHQQPDRPPIDFWGVESVNRQLTDYAGGRDPKDLLCVDFRTVAPRYLGKMPAVPPGCNGVDLWGAGYLSSEAFPQHVAYLPWEHIETMDQVAQLSFPTIADYDFSLIEEDCRRCAPYVVSFGNAGVFDIMNGIGARRRGYERLLCDIMTGEEVTLTLIDRAIELDYQICRKGLEAGRGMIDVLFIGEDTAHQGGPVFSPEVFRSFFVPRLKRFTDLAHEFGAVCRMHSCGATRPLIPIFTDEVGLDILDAVQPEPAGMNPLGLKRDFGDRLTFCGMLSLQQTFTHGRPEDCRREAEFLVKEIGKNGGYIFSGPNSFTADIPIENIVAAYEVAIGK